MDFKTARALQKKNRQWEVLAVWEFTQGLDNHEFSGSPLGWMCATSQSVD
jgi:hypothetical protein